MKEEKLNENFKKILHNAKLKITSPRLAVLKILSEFKHPLTVEQMHKKIGKNKTDLVTLYRTLASFEKKQLVKQVDLQRDAVYYELNTEHHHHMVCTNCHTVEDFENREIEKVLEQITKKSSKFQNIKKHSLELFGICKSCV